MSELLQLSRFWVKLDFRMSAMRVYHNEFIDHLSQRLLDQYLQVCGWELLSSRKLRTYRLFKNNLTYKPYLTYHIKYHLQSLDICSVV